MRSGVLILAVVTLASAPASARITRTRPTPTERWNPILPLTIGGGFEFERDSEQRQYDFPLLVEYNFSETLKLSVEPNFVYIDGKTPDVNTVFGFDDLETSVEWEFLPERRYRPALTAQGLVKWPTSTDPDIGDPGFDFGAGLIVSKDFERFDLDLSMLYIFSGDSQREDSFELSLASEVPLNRFLSVEAEVVHVFGTGGVRGTSVGSLGGPSGGADETEATIGLAWQVNPYLKFEQGFVLRDGGHWQIVFAWEWAFGGVD